MRECQEQALIQMLEIVQSRQMPVILHYRDGESGDAAARVLTIIRGDFANLKYHRQCFDGGDEELRQWQSLERCKSYIQHRCDITNLASPAGTVMQ